mmetsp:Transcript_1007/g.1971  ORF Transcript_1007/g.1971 Transcript_1007/m.1971 type:complete len:663 (+) Transcript_1007:11-1999(+)
MHNDLQGVQSRKRALEKSSTASEAGEKTDNGDAPETVASKGMSGGGVFTSFEPRTRVVASSDHASKRQRPAFFDSMSKRILEEGSGNQRASNSQGLPPMGPRRVPLQQVTEQDSNSTDMYSSILNVVNSNHPGKSNASRSEAFSSSMKLSRSLSAGHSIRSSQGKLAGTGKRHVPFSGGVGSQEVQVSNLGQALQTDWTLTTGVNIQAPNKVNWCEEMMLASTRMGGMSRASSMNAEQSLGFKSVTEFATNVMHATSYFTHPAQDLPSMLMSVLNKSKSRRVDALHSQFRMDGVGEISQAAGASLNKSTTASEPNIVEQQFMVSSVKKLGLEDDARTQNASDEGEAIGDFIFDRRCEWGAAFKSLYDLLTHGNCPYFYMVEHDAQGSSSGRLVALFLSKGTAAKGLPVVAMLSRSTKSLRFQLARCGVTYESPLDPTLSQDQNDVDVELQDELLAYSKSAVNVGKPLLGRSSSVQSTDDDSRSLLFFRGPTAVSGLYHVLLNRTVKRAGGHRIPRLISPVLFANAVPRAATVSKSFATLPDTVTKASKSRSANIAPAAVQMSGYFMPHRVTNILRAIASQSGASEQGLPSTLLHAGNPAQPPRKSVSSSPLQGLSSDQFKVSLAAEESTSVFNEALARVTRGRSLRTWRKFRVGRDVVKLEP